MKILFLDIDGVLNSSKYEPQINEFNEFLFIDESRMPILKTIIDKTDAKIVLTSTWRDCWNNDFNKCDKDGKYLTKVFNKYGLKIFDTTQFLSHANYYKRPKEISIWIGNTNEHIENYAILDDDDFDWGYHKERVVQTNPKFGYGLENRHIQQIMNILK